MSDAPGCGAIFSVGLPLNAPEGVACKDAPELADEKLEFQILEELQAHPAADARMDVSQAGALVLVVEDNRDMNAYLAEVLGRRHRVITAFDGEEGLAKALSSRPDLVVTDVMMPHMSGDKMMAALRLHPEMDDVPILVLTAKADEALRVKMLESGAQDYLSKPFSDEELLARVEGLAAYRRRLDDARVRLSAIVESSEDAIIGKDLEGIITSWNRAAQRLFGYTEAEALGKPMLMLFPAEQASEERAILERIGHGERVDHFETVRIGKDGNPVDVSIVISPIKDPQRRIIGASTIARDITEKKRAERLLRDSQIRLDLALQAAHMGVWSWDIVNDKRRFDEQVCRLLGIDPVAFTGTSEEFFRAIHPDDHETIKAALRRSVHEDAAYETEYRAVRSDGSVHYIAARGRVRRDATGRPMTINGVLWDITKLKRVEKELRESEERFRTIFEQAAVGVAQVDSRTGRFVRVNKKFCDIVGYSPEEMSDMRFQDITHPDHVQPDTDKVARLLAGDIGPYSIEKRYIHKNGSTVWVTLTVSPLRAEGLDPTFHIGIVQDITERKRAEQALLESEENYRNLFENAPIGIFQTDSRGRALTVNSAMATILGLASPQEAVEYYSDLGGQLYLRPERRDQFLSLLRREGHVKDFEYEAQTADKRRVWLSMNARVRSHHKDGSLLIEGFTTDITERKKAEAERDLMENQFHEAQRLESVGRLAGGVAHDFNNMLSVIHGHAEMAMEEVDPAHPLYADLMEIDMAARRSTDLTRQLLAFARRQTIAPVVLDLNETVEGMLKMLRRLIGEDIDLAWLPGKNLWSVKVDPSQVDQILANLSVNARDAITGVGKVTMETGNVAFDEAYCADHPGFLPGEFVLLAVSDNGSGMDRETFEKLFEPFFTTKGVGKGTGLGLATVYGIVKQNSGFINVYTEPGRGATFKIYLPRHGESIGEHAKAKAIESPGGKGETVLLVEDEAAILNMTVRMLERLGYTVLATGKPGEAVRIAEEHTGGIHLLMTDVVMPGMNGRDLAHTLLPLNPNMKCLFMSGYTANVIAHHGVLDEGVNFIQKPFSRQALAAKIREALEGKE